MRATTKNAIGIGVIALGSSVMAIPSAPVGAWEWIKTLASLTVNVGTAVMAFYNTSVRTGEGSKA